MLSSECTGVHLQVFLDVTEEVRSRMARGMFAPAFIGHMHTSRVRSVPSVLA